ncbi:hypothetical protein D3C85_1624150 [compost metagenome]
MVIRRDDSLAACDERVRQRYKYNDFQPGGLTGINNTGGNCASDSPSDSARCA